jgi:AcrR family transcriptional regulator
MRTSDGWLIPMPTTLGEDLAWSLVALAREQPLPAISFRGLARHARLAPGTITNHFASKQELLALSTTQIGRWLAHATTDHLHDRGPVGLFPATDDQTHRALTSAWAQLRAHALTEPAVDERVMGMTVVMRRSLEEALPDHRASSTATLWLWCEALRAELLRLGTDLGPADALALLERAGC